MIGLENICEGLKQDLSWHIAPVGYISHVLVVWQANLSGWRRANAAGKNSEVIDNILDIIPFPRKGSAPVSLHLLHKISGKLQSTVSHNSGIHKVDFLISILRPGHGNEYSHIVQVLK